jgi:hypothetical protein
LEPDQVSMLTEVINFLISNGPKWVIRITKVINLGLEIKRVWCGE